LLIHTRVTLAIAATVAAIAIPLAANSFENQRSGLTARNVKEA
jgi:hypothetical protein